MLVGENAFATVDSRRKWYRTWARLEAGARYLLRGEGTWTDAKVVCDAESYRNNHGVIRLEVLRVK